MELQAETRNMISGFTAGALTTLLLHPLDLIKTRLQISQKPISTLDMLRHVYKSERIRGLYSGLSANMTGASISWGLYFYLYSTFKNNSSSTDSSNRYFMHLISATKAGAITALITNPIWLIKTRMCTQGTEIKYTGLFNAFITITREEGFRALYKGLVPALFGVSHGAVQFMVYDELKHYFDSHSNTEFKSLEYIFMAVISKSIATIVTYPYQTVKSRLQTHVERFSFKSTTEVCKFTMKQEGVRGFYRGLGTNLFRVFPGTICTFLIYEFCMHSLK